MKKKNLNKKLNFSKNTVSDLSKVKGGYHVDTRNCPTYYICETVNPEIQQCLVP